MDRNQERELNKLSPFEVKNTLMDLAATGKYHSMINAGRGNPNWVATVPRAGFFQLGLFALNEADRAPSFKEREGFGGAGEKEGLGDRFKQFVADNRSVAGVAFLEKALNYCTGELGINYEELLVEWVNGILGDNYPVPDRMLKTAEKVVHAYLLKEMCVGRKPPQGKFDIFAVEGGTAAMAYIFYSLKAAKLINPGDTIATVTPVFTPYIEIPELEDYNLDCVHIKADENAAWQIPDQELDKLKDPKVKAFFLVNPSNPPSVRLSNETLNKIAVIANERPDLIILTDDVYGTFTNNFTSLAMIAPKNTILVYSFSKFYGATGWRLGAIALHEDNILDKKLFAVTGDEAERIHQRYHGITPEPNKLKFIDRLVADNRAVALNHTAGLSTPQQLQMVLFSLYSLTDEGAKYQATAKEIVRSRYAALIKNSPLDPLISPEDPNGAFYYVEIDIERLAKTQHGEEFFNWFQENHEPLHFVLRLAEEKDVVAMPGGGFGDTNWSLRLSLANLDDEAYTTITSDGIALLEEYFAEFKKN
ncbi:MAG: bifunctional aspartate transaminase/aspartate 4-decarboxylase [Deltaproteobacteria bacterium]|nr:bifunctional aspartate transaminase/aspartate 4-decarboxylase [Candidatus Tharpella aukensis]